MFRSRFSNAFSSKLPHYGPQDIERGVLEPVPGEHVEKLLCALLGLVLNRKKEVEYGAPTQASSVVSDCCQDTYVLEHISQYLADSCYGTGVGTTAEPWKKLFKRTLDNGRRHGMDKTLSTAVAVL
jgi:hypothetical protein